VSSIDQDQLNQDAQRFRDALEQLAAVVHHGWKLRGHLVFDLQNFYRATLNLKKSIPTTVVKIEQVSRKNKEVPHSETFKLIDDFEAWGGSNRKAMVITDLTHKPDFEGPYFARKARKAILV